MFATTSVSLASNLLISVRLLILPISSLKHYPVLLLLICATVWVYALFLFLELGGVAIVTLRGSVGAQRDHITFIPDTGIDTNAVCCHFQGCSAALPHTCDSPPASVRLCPFQDIFVVGHNFGLSSLLVPRSGEPNFDSNEADPFENKKRRQEREVKGLLDKIRPDMIALDPDFVGSLAPPTRLTTAVHDKLDIPFARLPRLERLRVQGRADETELDADAGADAVATEDDGGKNKKSRAEREKRKMRGKGKSLKRYLRKQRKNVIDPTAVRIVSPPFLSCWLFVPSWRSRGKRDGLRKRSKRGRWNPRNHLR
ncbi:NUC141 domain-containing protein [Boletus edulis BED1]|uniref:NUC141 domain-containing protein n=1 Tax=Boletus edulis BED1 TaxID=1328754 RepID=A0AAD4BEP7_BOLED|nr:NUC141 domain-containing protein [Boletus edulis BED1]